MSPDYLQSIDFGGGSLSTVVVVAYWSALWGALNRSEAYHQLRRAISSVNGDQFRGSSDEEIQLWNECARLVTNAIIHFNSSVLSQLLTSFEQQGDAAKIAIVKQASPVAWYDINLKGTYNFELSEKVPDSTLTG